ncbi:MAG: Holliday junction branch migration protein RuvA [Spirochaetales bacterium]|nr:Holliday junction branch migration protein RuvA [Spirochaetales bacterium]
MFNSISGKISYRDQESIYICTGGIEWDIKTTQQSLQDFPAEGQQAKAFIYLYHRDDQMRVYGFSTEKERSLFLDLLRVDGVGPKLVIKILSAITSDAFIKALEREDLATLSSLPGLGKKTAQKIILALQGKLKNLQHHAEGSSVNEDIINALVGMGYDKRSSREAVSAAVHELNLEELSGEELDKQLFTKALSIAGRKKT